MRISDDIYVGEPKIPIWIKFVFIWNVIVISADVIIHQITPLSLGQYILIYFLLWWFTGLPFVAEKFMLGFSKEETRIDSIYKKKLIKRHIGGEVVSYDRKEKTYKVLDRGKFLKVKYYKGHLLVEEG
ncbi:hypothetical protein MOB41_17265 [Bacillus haynesii]|uniref:hypothetical protein n=1 Tax=Bacillus haynesii TaxID=1925021 RepID=UPI0022827233|nr:hypothetical protein [Bacillus haynesii]MCY7780153.1 hypothetical protein [Bacillus haynesii]MEC0672809.1 hypothetical protein [Bacillus haynesii]